MPLIYNGILCNTIEQLEAQIGDLSDAQKTFIRNDFNGIPNSHGTPVPLAVSPRQIRVALVMSGIPISTIEAMLNALPEPDKTVAKITWEYTIEFNRNHPMLLTLAPLLGLSSAQLDSLFILAATL